MRYGSLNAEGVPLQYRFDMQILEGRVAGDLGGTRLALVEEALSTARRKEPECIEISDDDDNSPTISFDSDSGL